MTSEMSLGKLIVGEVTFPVVHGSFRYRNQLLELDVRTSVGGSKCTSRGRFKMHQAERAEDRLILTLLQPPGANPRSPWFASSSART